MVASQVSGAVNILNNSGCAEVKGNEDMTQKILVGFAANPNVYGVVVIGLGCENVSHSQLRESILKVTNKPVVSFGIQEEGGTPTGHALAPVLKVTANRATYQNMIDNMDIDASGVTEGEVSIEEAGASMLDEVLEVCNGKTTKAESYGFSDIAIDRICRFI